MKCNNNFALITVSNPKFERSNTRRELVAGLSLAPAKLSGVNLCGNNTEACTRICINFEGYGKFNKTQQARLRRSHMFLEDRERFRSYLLKDLESLERWSRKYEVDVYFRPNTYSDLDWSKLMPEIFEIPLNYYDYSKNYRRVQSYLAGELPKNYDLVLSRSERNGQQCEEYLAMGGNVAVVWRDRKEIPSSYLGYPVVDGVSSDLWWRKQRSVVGGLKAIGSRARADRSGFVLG